VSSVEQLSEIIISIKFSKFALFSIELMIEFRHSSNKDALLKVGIHIDKIGFFIIILILFVNFIKMFPQKFN